MSLSQKSLYPQVQFANPDANSPFSHAFPPPQCIPPLTQTMSLPGISHRKPKHHFTAIEIWNMFSSQLSPKHLNCEGAVGKRGCGW